MIDKLNSLLQGANSKMAELIESYGYKSNEYNKLEKSYNDLLEQKSLRKKKNKDLVQNIVTKK
jgi:hypothetical protein